MTPYEFTPCLLNSENVYFSSILDSKRQQCPPFLVELINRQYCNSIENIQISQVIRNQTLESVLEYIIQ